MPKAKSILEELNQISVDRDRNHVTSNRGEHVITSAINLIEQIEYADKNYDKCLNIKNQTGKLQEELIAETIENLETDMLEQINTVKNNLEKEIKYNIDNLTLLRKRQQNKFLKP